MILVDTSVWIDFLRSADSVQRHVLRRLIEEDEDICITGIILTEILQGVRHDKHFQKVKDYLLEFPLYNPKGIETYISAAALYRRCRRRGKTVKRTIDCLIAAICIENKLTLLHKDSDFDQIAKCTELEVLKV
jgi:hypothetical protein